MVLIFCIFFLKSFPRSWYSSLLHCLLAQCSPDQEDSHHHHGILSPCIMPNPEINLSILVKKIFVLPLVSNCRDHVFSFFYGQKRPATNTTRIDARPLPSSYWPMWTKSRGFQYISLKDSAWAIPWYPILSRIWCVARMLRQFCCLKHSIFTSLDCATALPSRLPASPVSS